MVTVNHAYLFHVSIPSFSALFAGYPKITCPYLSSALANEVLTLSQLRLTLEHNQLFLISEKRLEDEIAVACCPQDIDWS